MLRPPPQGGAAPTFITQASFDPNYEPVNSTYPNGASGQWVVQAGDTLSAIAQATYGDSSLWYLVAQANGLGGDSDLRVGETLTIPSRTGDVHNTSQTHAPYNPSKIVGSTRPNLPVPQGDSSNGCGVVGTIIVIVVAAVVTYFTAGALSGVMSAWAAGAIGAAAGSIASQEVGIAIGVQQGFSWSQVGMAALGGAVSGAVNGVQGLDGTLHGGMAGSSVWNSGAAGVVERTMVANAVTQGLDMAVGYQKSFNWTDVAAAGAGSYVGAEVGGGAKPGATFGQRLVTAEASGFAAGATTAVLGGGKLNIERVATDAFGNALGSGLADEIDAPPTITLSPIQSLPVNNRDYSNLNFVAPAQVVDSNSEAGGSVDGTGSNSQELSSTDSGGSASSGVASGAVDQQTPTINLSPITQLPVARSIGYDTPDGAIPGVAIPAPIDGQTVQGRYVRYGDSYYSVPDTANPYDYVGKRVFDISSGELLPEVTKNEAPVTFGQQWDEFWKSPTDPLFNAHNFGPDFWTSIPKGGVNALSELGTFAVASAMDQGSGGAYGTTMLNFQLHGWDGDVFHAQPGNDAQWGGLGVGNLWGGFLTGEGLGSLVSSASKVAPLLEDSMWGARPTLVPGPTSIAGAGYADPVVSGMANDFEALKASYAAQDSGYIPQATQIDRVSTFKTLGVDTASAKAYLSSGDGQNLISALWAADPAADAATINARAMDLLSTGSDLPQVRITNSPLLKIVPEGQSVSPYSPFFTTPEELLRATQSGSSLADWYGIPLKSESPSYSVFQIDPLQPAGVFDSTVAPTVELNGMIQRTGQGVQSIVPNRALWSDPRFIGTVGN